ncbi:hypothetical protein GRJ2_002131300 [Grus japonensis]|uniref:Uncharacterized protein n=1 Tax=Grus japonensis TaxID=30415 RepID=A0ABC9XG79_GRUJA
MRPTSTPETHACGRESKSFIPAQRTTAAASSAFFGEEGALSVKTQRGITDHLLGKTLGTAPPALTAQDCSDEAITLILVQKISLQERKECRNC